MTALRTSLAALLVIAGVGLLPAAPPDEQAQLATLASDAGLHDKARACQKLAVVGGPEAIPALAALLGHEHLATYARSGLEMIDDPAAGAALRAALPNLEGRLLAGTVISLGVRRDSAAVPELRKLALDPQCGVSDEALFALGRIATEDATRTLAKVLTGDSAQHRIAAAHAALDAAGQLAKAGNQDRALKLLEVLRQSDTPAVIRSAAARQTTALGGATGTGESTRLFDGATTTGWEGDLTWFRIEDGSVVAGSLTKPIPQNEFLCTTREFGDFDLRLKVRLVGNKGNGGIQIRSQRIPGTRELQGYQADIAPSHWGGLYDESRRRKFLGKAPDTDALAKLVKPDQWNDYRIRCEGPRVRLWLNGQLTVDFTETDPAIPRTGIIGLQIHGGPPAEVRYKDIEIQELPPAGD